MRSALLLAVLIGRTPYGQTQVTAARATQPQRAKAHQDHEARHGGIFFMAMDSHHHLEGVLEAPGILRVYLYDSHTEPLATDRMKQASGRVLVGDFDNAPEIPLTMSRDGKTLEASLGSRVRLPVTLTLLLRFPGMATDARPELFTFPFREYSKPATTHQFLGEFGLSAKQGCCGIFRTTPKMAHSEPFRTANLL